MSRACFIDRSATGRDFIRIDQAIDETCFYPLAHPEVSLAFSKALICAALASLVLVPAVVRGVAEQPQSANQTLPLVHSDNGSNTPAAQAAHYVVLVSLSGYRWDYAKREKAAHLLALGNAGVWAPDGMMPSYPALSFVNDYSIAAGLYPEHHGIVADEFIDPESNTRFSVEDHEAVANGGWYGGTPLWSLAEKQGMRTACISWPGSEAKIAGFRPTWYAESSPKAHTAPGTEQTRVDGVIGLLRRPGEDRPHLILVSIAEPEMEAQQSGPDASATRTAELRMDELIGKLKSALDATGLPINVIVVSDHGVAPVQGGWMALDQFADLKGFDGKSDLLYAQNEQDRVRVYEQLKKATSQFMVFRRRNVPAELSYNQNPREGDPVIIATGPYAIRARTPASGQTDKAPRAGVSGFDPRRVPEMKAIFFAAGPDIVEGKTVAPFENVNLYPWLAHILGLTPAKNDGNLNILAGTLRDGGNEPDGGSGK